MKIINKIWVTLVLISLLCCTWDFLHHKYHPDFLLLIISGMLYPILLKTLKDE